jgi:hypothetical protein
MLRDAVSHSFSELESLLDGDGMGSGVPSAFGVAVQVFEWQPRMFEEAIGSFTTKDTKKYLQQTLTASSCLGFPLRVLRDLRGSSF